MTRIIGKYGYDGWLRRSPDLPPELGEDAFSPTQDVSAEVAQATGARRFRLMLEELGPTFIKFGQVLSARPDLVAPSYIEELKHLQDHCEPLDSASIRAAIEEELERTPDELFAWFDPAPLATASIAQVHRARTRDGADVVVKVRRPGIRDAIRGDLDILYRVAQLLEAVVEESQLADPVALVREFERAVTAELDFRNEADNLREFGRLHEHRAHVVIPRPHESLCAAGILVMDYLDGVPFNRLPADCDRKAIARRIVEEAFQEVFLDGVFHGDPHPGNLLYLGEDRYGILDFGLVGRLTPQMQDMVVVLSLGIALQDPDSVARTLVRLGRPGQRIDIGQVRRDVSATFDAHLGRPIEDVDSRHLLQTLLELGMKHGIRVPSEYAHLTRAASTIEGLVRELDPKLDLASVARPYAERLMRERVSPETLQGGVYRALLQFQGLQQDIPIQLSQILTDAASGRLGVSLSGPEVERIHTSIGTAANTVAGAILAGAFIIGAFIGLARLEGTVLGVPLVGIFGAVVGALVLFGLTAYVGIRPRLRKLRIRRLLGRRRSR